MTDFQDIDLKSIRGLCKELEAQLEELRGHL
jgi:DNA-binding Xre family transcriptional regulator